jgi:hypothetical protein
MARILVRTRFKSGNSGWQGCWRRPNGYDSSNTWRVMARRIFEHVCKLGLEGIMSKRRDMPYRTGTSKTWLKIKNPLSPAVLRFNEN